MYTQGKLRGIYPNGRIVYEGQGDVLPDGTDARDVQIWQERVAAEKAIAEAEIAVKLGLKVRECVCARPSLEPFPVGQDCGITWVPGRHHVSRHWLILSRELPGSCEKLRRGWSRSSSRSWMLLSRGTWARVGNGRAVCLIVERPVQGCMRTSSF